MLLTKHLIPGALALAMVAAQAAAAPVDDRYTCEHGSAEVGVPACNRAISSGRFNGRDLAALYSERGARLGNLGEYTRAIKDLDRAIQLSPPTDTVLKYRCWVLTIAGQPQRALADCDRSLQLKSDDAGALNSRGLAYLRLGQLDHAIADYDAALRISQKFPSVLYGRGIAKLKKGDTIGGNADIVAATKIQPNIAEDFARYGVK